MINGHRLCFTFWFKHIQQLRKTRESAIEKIESTAWGVKSSTVSKFLQCRNPTEFSIIDKTRPVLKTKSSPYSLHQSLLCISYCDLKLCAPMLTDSYIDFKREQWSLVRACSYVTKWKYCVSFTCINILPLLLLLASLHTVVVEYGQFG